MMNCKLIQLRRLVVGIRCKLEVAEVDRSVFGRWTGVSPYTSSYSTKKSEVKVKCVQKSAEAKCQVVEAFSEDIRSLDWVLSYSQKKIK